MNRQAKTELLAPAGSNEAFFAAMEAGADAVYCGLRDFSARAKARNFDLRELERVVAYARRLDRRLYVTLNTLVKEAELPQLVETLGSLEAIGVDALIIQDLAIWRLVRDHFPGLPLHASTQMTVHNSAGVRQLERMGFERAVLARELTLEEIRAIRAHTSMELEHFIHGALCFSFSGQCFFSSFLGGKSGNRGRCAQPCRRRYHYRGKEGYYFSPNDLSAIDLLDELAGAGVTSFKIEGRMKSAEYVHQVVRAYRQVLDAPAKSRKEAIRGAKGLLKDSFGRQPTRGFLTGPSPTDIATPSRKGSTGRFLGEVQQVRGGDISFKTNDSLHLGDRLRVQPKSDRAGSAFTVKTLRQGRQQTKKVSAGAYVSVPSPFRDAFRPGDAVFKVSSDQAFTLSEAACRRKLSQVATVPHRLDLHIVLQDDELRVRGEVDGAVLERSYPVETTAAQTSPLSEETLRGVFERSADKPFVLNELTAVDLPPVVIPPSRLKEVRRAFYDDLAAAISSRRAERRRYHLAQARAALLLPSSVSAEERRELTVMVRDVRDAHVLNDAEVDWVMLPLSTANIHGVRQLGRRLQGREDRVVWDLPFVIFDAEWDFYRQAVEQLVGQGYCNFRLNNVGHFRLFDGLEGLRLSTGYRLFSLNSQALLAWKELGAVEATLYLEDDRENLGELFRRPVGMEKALTVYAAVPVITSRITVRGVRPDAPVLSDRGEGYRVSRHDNLSTVTPETDFSLIGRLGELEAMGCRKVVVDLVHCGPFSAKGKKVREALSRDQGMPGTSSFNFEHGME